MLAEVDEELKEAGKIKDECPDCGTYNEVHHPWCVKTE